MGFLRRVITTASLHAGVSEQDYEPLASDLVYEGLLL